ncbi:MAG: histidine kinase [Ferruginibacter sp.]|nr:histidine kinase [Ferruginibacter sp.]
MVISNYTEIIAKSILVPLAGICIPFITGLYKYLGYPLQQAITHVLLPCVLVSFLIWEGNVRTMRQLRNKWYRKDQYVYSDFMRRIAIHLLFTFFISLTGISLIMYAAGKSDSGILFKTIAAVIIFVIIVTCVYEIIYLTEERETSTLKAEELNYAKSEAELTALKNQIDPHFIFNSINTLSHLIKTAPEVAYLFNNNLATIYRYILFNKDKEFVLLKEELEFVSHNFYLFRIRYEKAVNLLIEIADVKTENYLIPPISLQLLVENAIKHNEFSDEFPMNISIQVNNNFVTVKNKIIPKKYFLPSSKIGLHNLSNRYRILTKKEIIVESDAGYFIVKLPLLTY